MDVCRVLRQVDGVVGNQDVCEGITSWDSDCVIEGLESRTLRARRSRIFILTVDTDERSDLDCVPTCNLGNIIAVGIDVQAVVPGRDGPDGVVVTVRPETSPDGRSRRACSLQRRGEQGWDGCRKLIEKPRIRASRRYDDAVVGVSELGFVDQRVANRRGPATNRHLRRLCPAAVDYWEGRVAPVLLPVVGRICEVILRVFAHHGVALRDAVVDADVLLPGVDCGRQGSRPVVAICASYFVGQRVILRKQGTCGVNGGKCFGVAGLLVRNRDSRCVCTAA